MEDGLIILHTDEYGSAMKQVSVHIIQEGTGHIQAMAGHGYLLIIGAGRPFIMGAGSLIPCMAGYGCPAMNGRLPGFHGARAVMFTVGPLYIRALTSQKDIATMPRRKNGSLFLINILPA